MPGLCYQPKEDAMMNDYHKVVCNCKSCPCRKFDPKRPGTKSTFPANGIVFQLPRYREPKSDTYSHTVYKKEMCNRFLMKQLTASTQRKAKQRPKKPPVFESERFNYKSLADMDYRKYSPAEVAQCKAKFPRITRKEESYFKPGEYSCNVKFPSQSTSHEDYCPKVPISSGFKICKRECAIPPFEGLSCYYRDYRAPPLDAYSVNRRIKKRIPFD